MFSFSFTCALGKNGEFLSVLIIRNSLQNGQGGGVIKIIECNRVSSDGVVEPKTTCIAARTIINACPYETLIHLKVCRIINKQFKENLSLFMRSIKPERTHLNVKFISS